MQIHVVGGWRPSHCQIRRVRSIPPTICLKEETTKRERDTEREREQRESRERERERGRDRESRDRDRDGDGDEDGDSDCQSTEAENSHPQPLSFFKSSHKGSRVNPHLLQLLLNPQLEPFRSWTVRLTQIGSLYPSPIFGLPARNHDRCRKFLDNDSEFFEGAPFHHDRTIWALC